MSVVKGLARVGLSRGLLGGSRGWLYLGVGALALRALKWLAVEPEKTVYSEVLKPGEGIEIRTVRPER